MKFEWNAKQMNALQMKLMQKSLLDFNSVNQKNIREIFKRSQQTGGTPVGDYTGGGGLRKSAQYAKNSMGYLMDYAPNICSKSAPEDIKDNTSDSSRSGYCRVDSAEMECSRFHRHKKRLAPFGASL